ncbi:MAG: hypothetical protein WDO14_20905 [Bacteroidota bacterium]
MEEQVDNETIHAVLGALSKGNKTEWNSDELASEIRKWYQLKPSVHKVSAACQYLELNEDILNEFELGQWEISDDDGELELIRRLYYSGKYKPKKKWWVLPVEILTAIASLFAIFQVLDNSQSKRLNDRLNKSQDTIQSQRQQHEEDSVEIERLRKELQRTDSPIRPSKP